MGEVHTLGNIGCMALLLIQDPHEGRNESNQHESKAGEPLHFSS